MGMLDKRHYSDERRIIAHQVSKARRSERLNNEDSYGIDRTGKEYLYRIGGLENLFRYIGQLSLHKVLDVGVGNGNASHVISKMPISRGIDLEVTALRNTRELRQHFTPDKIHLTSIETLRGIPDKSLAAVIGQNSIAYSDKPLLAVKRLNQVLIPGGVVKATFNSLGEEEEHNGVILKDPTKFEDGFSVLGYDVACIDNFSWTTRGLRLYNSILLAIKPGNNSAPSANELLNSDLEAIKSQATDTLLGYPVFDIDEE